jgi:hypothetical protein
MLLKDQNAEVDIKKIPSKTLTTKLNLKNPNDGFFYAIPKMKLCKFKLIIIYLIKLKKFNNA